MATGCCMVATGTRRTRAARKAAAEDGARLPGAVRGSPGPLAGGVAGGASPPEQAAVSKPSAMTSAARPRRGAHMTPFSQPAHSVRLPTRGMRGEPSAAVAEDVSQFAREGLGLAGVSELAAEEAAVVAGEHDRLLAEQLGGGQRRPSGEGAR